MPRLLMNLVKTGVLVVGVMGVAAFISRKISKQHNSTELTVGSIYEFTLKTLDGNEIPFSKYRGKKLLIVNTASKCGKTPQYAGLQKLHEQYGNHVTVLGFPANNFLWQEPGTNKEIAAFCERNYGVTFQMFEKISVKGSDQHPLYAWLQSKTGKKPDWNFAKYLVREDGETVHYFNSGVQPLDQAIISAMTQ